MGVFILLTLISRRRIVYPQVPGRGFLVENTLKAMNIKEYIKETKAELKHVTWPTRKQAIAFTIGVIVVSIVISLFLGVFDSLFSALLKQIV